MAELLKRIVSARRLERAAEERVRDAVREAFPIGMYVEIPWGRGFVRGWIEEHGANWADPLNVHLRLQSNDRLIRISVFSLLPEVGDA